MSRNQEFRSREPFNRHPSLKLHSSLGPFSFLNPTRARYEPQKHKTPPSDLDDTTPRHTLDERETDAEKHGWVPMAFEWRSRDNRKGRHTIVIEPSLLDTNKYSAPAETATLRASLSGIKLMFTYFPYWDISWLVAVIFTLGSVVWVINAFFVFLPLVRPSTEFEGEISVGGGWTAFIGATVFEFGSIFLILEAINENRAGCFGWALDKVLNDVEGKGKLTLKPEVDGCAHHHTNKKNFLGKGAHTGLHVELDSIPPEHGGNEKSTFDDKKGWQWYPSWKDLTHHYIYELGFLASFFQLLGATIFWISGFTALPAIFEVLAEDQNTLDGAYWVPQIIGGSGFIISRYVLVASHGLP